MAKIRNNFANFALRMADSCFSDPFSDKRLTFCHSRGVM